jgi:hypothetical protein
LDDGALVLKRLEDEHLGDHDGDHIHGVDMPPPSTSKFPDARALPLASEHPTLPRGHVVVGCVPQTLPPTPAPLLHRSRIKKLEVSHGKRKS